VEITCSLKTKKILSVSGKVTPQIGVAFEPTFAGSNSWNTHISGFCRPYRESRGTWRGGRTLSVHVCQHNSQNRASSLLSSLHESFGFENKHRILQLDRYHCDVIASHASPWQRSAQKFIGMKTRTLADVSLQLFMSVRNTQIVVRETFGRALMFAG
jgi:hypothetical protein